MALETLNPYRHTLGVLYILLAKHTQFRLNYNYTILFRQTKDFILEASPEQLPHAAEQFCELCHQLTSQLVERQMPLKGIHLLQVTSIHLSFDDICILEELNHKQIVLTFDNRCILRSRWP